MKDKSKKVSLDELFEELLSDEELYNFEHTEWRKPQGEYSKDVDAKKKLKNFYRTSLQISQWVTVALVILTFLGMLKMTFFTTYEITILDDSSQLFCTIEEDGAVAIAY